MGQIARKKLFTILIIPILLMPMASLTYAHLTASVEKKYKFYLSFPLIEIGSYKVLSKYDDCLIQKWLQDNTLTIQTRVFPGWYAWIGLILHNAGDQPCEVYAPIYNVYDPNNVWQYFTHTEYFYGPYDKGEFATADPKVWDGLKWWQLPPKVDPVDPPIMLEYCHKLVLWIKLKYNPTYDGSMYGLSESDSSIQCGCWPKFKIKISIQVPCVPKLTEDSCWTWPPP